MPYDLHVKDVERESMPWALGPTDERLDGNDVLPVLGGLCCFRYDTAADGHAALTRVRSRPDVPAVDRSRLTLTFWLSDWEKERWRCREARRFESGTYTRIPWSDIDSQPDHFAHLSLKTPGLVAYTENDEKGALDRQTAVRPGKYLAQYYPHLSKTDTDRYIAACLTDLPTLELTTAPDQCEFVYTHGPRSCMSRPAHAYQGHCHPARIYGNSPDLALAFVRNTADPDRIVARCVVWPALKIAVRVYPPDHAVMYQLLEQAGYTICDRTGYDDVLDGARVRAIVDRNGHGFIMGYVDGIGYCKAVGEYLILGRGSLSCSNTKVWNGDTIACGTTGAYVDEDADEDTSYACGRCGSRTEEDEGDGTLCQSCLDDQITCSLCDRTSNINELESYELTQSGDILCRSCATDATCVCEIEDCCESWIEGVEFTRREQRDRTARHVTDLCRSCADEYNHCASCDDYTLAESMTCDECSSTDIDRPRDDRTLPLPLDESEVTSCEPF